MRAFLSSVNWFGSLLVFANAENFCSKFYLTSMHLEFSCNLFLNRCEYTDAWMKGQEVVRAGELESVHFAERKFG